MPPVYLLLHALVEKGYRVHWILIGRDGSRRKAFSLLDGRLEVMCVQSVGPVWLGKLGQTKLRHLKTSQFLHILTGAWKALLFLRHTRVNVIYGMTPTGALIGTIASWFYRIPRVSRLHGSLLYFHYLTRRSPWLYYHFPAEVAVFKWPGAALILTNDGTRSDQLARRFRTDPERVYFLLNGVDKSGCRDRCAVRKATRKRLGVGTGTTMLATVSRLSDWKRVDRAIRGVAAIRKQGLDCRLFIVGDGPDRRRLEDLSAESEVMEQVCFVGSVPHHDARDILSSTDVFLSLYDYSNLGNPIIEAMIAGRCIISIDDGSLEDIIVHDRNGVLLRPDNVEAELQAQLTRLIGNPALRRSLGKAARQYAMDRFWTWQHRISAELAIIDALSSGKPLDKREWKARWMTAGEDRGKRQSASTSDG